MLNYQIGEEIGSGGMGVVYRSHQPALHRDVAIKFIHRHFAKDPDSLKLFLREARTAAQIDAPNVVRIFDAGEDDDRGPYIVMELLDGESLRDRLDRGPIPEEQVVDIAIQALSGLEAAHKLRIIHRDIKPGNIQICRDGRVKLLDFGIAKPVGDAGSTSKSVLIGTAEYMSPEQARGEPIDGRTDLYSLGIVVYQMLTGEVPFKAATPLAVLELHVHREPPSLSRVAPRMAKILAKALAKRPEDRYRSASDMRAALQAAYPLTDTGVIHPPPPVPTPRPPSKLLVAAAMAAVAIIGGLFLFSKRPSSVANAVDGPILPRASREARPPTPPPDPMDNTQTPPTGGQSVAPAPGSVEDLLAAGQSYAAQQQKQHDAMVRDLLAAGEAFASQQQRQNAPRAELLRRIGVEKVSFPAGWFPMGDDDQSDNKPHRVYLDPYWISKTPVTVGQFKAYCADKGIPFWNHAAPDWGWIDDHPMVYVTWQEARDFCRWAGGDLPTEAQWERAARGTEGRKYPWGNEWDPGRLQWSSDGKFGSAGRTASVTAHPGGATPEGCLDIAGNVWQWCSDGYAPITSTGDVRNPAGMETSRRVLRGGSWCDNVPSNIRSAYRALSDPRGQYNYFGFRLAGPP